MNPTETATGLGEVSGDRMMHQIYRSSPVDLAACVMI